MDWFERLTGFVETDVASTRQRLSMHDGMLVSSVNGRRYRAGRLELLSLGELRAMAAAASADRRRSTVSTIRGDVRSLHAAPENAGALFQVASQFNLLEMVGPHVSPEQGVTRYEHDHTQGPACAMAAGAATIHRNYFVPVDGGIGQTRDRQINALADLGRALGHDQAPLWSWQNGYALCLREGLARVARQLDRADEAQTDRLRSLLRIGVHWDVEVTDTASSPGPIVSQAFCSALPVAYAGAIPRAEWAPFARLVLEAAYEATLQAARVNLARGASPRVLLTRLGGGAFGNDDAWIDDAIDRALHLAGDAGLEIVHVRR